jgi:hypothetical protein
MRFGRFLLRYRPFGSLVAHALLALPLAAAAELKAPADSDPWMPRRFAYAVPTDAFAPRIGGHAPQSAPDERDAPPALRANRWSSASLVEMPRDAMPGRYQRPRYALGFRSDALRGWLKEAGFEAHTCIAPVLRLRTKLSGEGELSGAVWLYARCSFR